MEPRTPGLRYRKMSTKPAGSSERNAGSGAESTPVETNDENEATADAAEARDATNESNAESDALSPCAAPDAAGKPSETDTARATSGAASAAADNAAADAIVLQFISRAVLCFSCKPRRATPPRPNQS